MFQAPAGVEQVVREAPREGLAAAEDLQARAAPPARLEEHAPGRRRGLHDGRAGAARCRAARRRPWRRDVAAGRSRRGRRRAAAGRARGRRCRRRARWRRAGRRRRQTPSWSRMAQRKLTSARWGIMHALGLAGGAGGVDHVGEARRRRRVGGGVRSARGRSRSRSRSRQIDVGVAGRSSGARRCCGEQDADLGVLEHEGEAVARVGGVEGEVGAARLEDGEQRDEHVERALEADADERRRGRRRGRGGGGRAGWRAGRARGR